MYLYISKISILFALYFITARFGLTMNATSGFASLVWAPTGIALASLLLYGYKLWPAIALAAFSVNLATGAPFLSAFGISVGNTLEALIAAHLLCRYADFHKTLDRTKDVVAFLIIAVLLSTLVSASVGVTSLWLGQIIPTEKLAEAWYAWWRGDLYGNLIITPLLLVLGTRKWGRIEAKVALEVSIFVLLMTGTCLLVFGKFHGSIDLPNLPFLFILFPFTIWASLRLGQTGNVVTIFLLSAFAIWGAATGAGPFATGSFTANLLHLHAYIGALAVTGLVLAASAAERMSALRALYESQSQLKSALKNRDEFISIASHELKSPLALIALNLQSLRKSSSLESLATKVQSCENHVNRLCTLVDDLMDLTRIRSGKLELHRERVDLSELTKEIIARQPASTPENVSVVTVKADMPVIGSWDRTRIEQVLTNLLSNAHKYGDHAPIEISVEMSPERNFAKLEVKDQGIGVPLEMRDEIFECFKRAHPGNAIQGLGLGLYIVRQIAEAHGGVVRLESGSKQGSTFTVELPTGI